MTGQLVAILALIAASQARIAAMQVENQDRMNRGFDIAYPEESFLGEADLLTRLSIEARNA